MIVPTLIAIGLLALVGAYSDRRREQKDAEDTLQRMLMQHIRENEGQ